MVAQGSFSFPDADLSQPAIVEYYSDPDEFTSFDLMADGHTFTLADFYFGAYVSSSSSFMFFPASPDGVGCFLNRYTPPSHRKPIFEVPGVYSSPCYYLDECGPEYPSVFEGYALDIFVSGEPGGPADLVYGIYFDTIVITPATSVSEPGSASLLLFPLVGLVLLARSKGWRPNLLAETFGIGSEQMSPAKEIVAWVKRRDWARIPGRNKGLSADCANLRRLGRK